MTVIIIIGIVIFLLYAASNKKELPIENTTYSDSIVKMKSKNTVSFLALFLGGIGVHRFYLGQTAKGILSLIFFWTCIPFFISLIDFIIFITMSEEKFNLKYNPLLRNVNSNRKNKEAEPKQLVQKPIKDIKVAITTSCTSNNYNDDSIINITNQSSNSENINSTKLTEKKEKQNELIWDIIESLKMNNTSANLQTNLIDESIIDITDQYCTIPPSSNLKHYVDVPKWKHQYVYSHDEINRASNEQKKFYDIFRSRFLNGDYCDLEGNTNYAFILLFDLLGDYDDHRNISKLEGQLKNLGQCYPKTKSYAISFLQQKTTNNTAISKEADTYSYINSYEDYWELGSKYKDKLILNDEDVKLLNNIYYPSNNFFNIEHCALEILKLYIALISALKNKYIQEETTIDKQFLIISDIIARKEFKYRKGSPNYKYIIESTTREFYSRIFKYCENAVREYYGHKRKLNTNIYYNNEEAIKEFETKIISKVTELLPILILKASPPEEAIEIELYSQNTNRWKIKFEELIANYNKNSNEFIASIYSLASLNEKNPSIENIFFEASKFISNYDKESALTFYVYYLYCDLESTTFNNKQLTKTIQKNLFKTNEQLHAFEKIISELIKDKDINKALEGVSNIYKVKRKKIQLNTASIKEVQKQHSGTVELLNEYLKDDFDDENKAIKSQDIRKEEIQIEITQKKEEAHQSSFVSELSFTTIHTTTLELFAKSNFSISQEEFEVFTKSKGVFKNSLIESINDTCYEFLDDVLIEEEEDYYTINANYFHRISAK
jgi:TM2 domain-containing membrane protein YozV